MMRTMRAERTSGGVLKISSAMLVRESRTISANGAFGRHERLDHKGPADFSNNGE
jgi:hypothetical protein